jgi:hypothetical protein
MEEVWRIYNEERRLVGEYDTEHDFNRAWENVQVGWYWRKEPKWKHVPAPVRSEEGSLRRFRA